LGEGLWGPAFPGNINGGRLVEGVTLAWVIDTEYYFSEGILVILHKTLNAFMDTWAYLSMYIQGLTSYFVRSIKIARKHT
jgi:hypothetical protein